MFYSQVILAKKGPLAKVWLAAHWGDKKLARPQIFATDISQSCTDVMNPSVPLALRLSGHLLLGIVRIYSRKVKYVLNDCTEAMLKLQMAFATTATSSGGKGLESGRELLTEADAPTHQLVANFGEFDQVHIVEGFCLPLPEDNEWILADESQFFGDGEGSSSNDPNLLHLPTANSSQQKAALLSPGNDEEEEEEETWAPFDPDNDEDDEEEETIPMEGLPLPRNSHVSEIEIVRAGANNDSMLSEDQTRRSTSLLDGSTLTENAPSTANNNNEEEDYDFGVPFGDDSEDEKGGNNINNMNVNSNALTFGDSTNLGDSDLLLSRDGEDGGTPLPNTSGLAMDEDDDQHSASGTKRRAEPINDQEDANTTTTQPQPRKKRRRKRRKVVIDNNDTELTTEHIRSMLQNADDLVAPMPHPASLWDDDNNSNNNTNNEASKDYRTLVEEERRKRELEERGTSHKRSVLRGDPSVPILTQPFLVDLGTQGQAPGQAQAQQLHPLLQQLWQDNYWKALGQPCPYQRLDDDNDDTEAEDDVETVRRDASHINNDDTSTVGSDLNIPNNDGEDGTNKNATTTTEGLGEQDEGFEFPPAIDDDDDELETDTPIPDFGDDDQDETAAALRKGAAGDNIDHNDDLLDLGMVNDMILDSDEDENHDEDDDDDAEPGENDRQTAGSSTKWHKHTVRVFSHLKKCLGDNDNTNDNDNNDNTNTTNYNSSVDFHELTKHMVSRRNASSVFFEMLQLKTWDFIELDQDEPYGTISVSKGARFSEDVPKD